MEKVSKTFMIEPDLSDRLNEYCAENDKVIGRVIEKAIKKYLDEEEKV